MGWQEVAFNGCAFIAGLFLLEFGAERFIEHTAISARRLGISPALIALLTAGAEWEELVVVVAATLQQKPNLALGNVVGSSISNILGAFSLGLLFHHPGPIIFDRSSKVYTTLQLLLSTIVAILAYYDALTKAVGGVLLAIFIMYVASIGYSIYKGIVAPPELSDSDSDTEDNSDDDAEDGNHNVTSSLLGSGLPLRKPQRSLIYHGTQLFLGFLALSISGYILSHSATVLAEFFHLSGTIMGITILSFATTLPEKFVAIVGGSRGERAIVVANTAGSNIFLLSLCLGVTLLSFGGGVLNDSISVFEIVALWVSSAMFFIVVVFGSNRWVGLILFVMYIVFIALEFTVFKH